MEPRLNTTAPPKSRDCREITREEAVEWLIAEVAKAERSIEQYGLVSEEEIDAEFGI